jgi:hypothetical protein
MSQNRALVRSLESMFKLFLSHVKYNEAATILLLRFQVKLSNGLISIVRWWFYWPRWMLSAARSKATVWAASKRFSVNSEFITYKVSRIIIKVWLSHWFQKFVLASFCIYILSIVFTSLGRFILAGVAKNPRRIGSTPPSWNWML